MKKIIGLIIVLLLVVTGCDNLMNTPTKKVEKLLSNYQKLDEDVLKQLDDVISNETILDNNLKNRYQDLMKKQYKDLTYTIKEETIDGNISVVEVEIEVYDYNKAIKEAEEYLLKNSSEFKNSVDDVDTSKYNEYKIKLMEDMKERITYTINFTLSKVEDKWIVDDLTETERSKIHGLYAY